VLAAVVVGLAVFGFVRYSTRVAAEAERAVGRARAEAAVLAERQRIGREMHDGVAQALFLLRVRVDEAEERLAGGDVDAVRGQLAAVRTQVAAAHAEVRAAIADLRRASAVEDMVEALRREAAPVAAALGVELQMAVDDLPRLDARALTNREIAGRLGLSEQTIKNHLKHILQKLHLKNRVGLAVYAKECGLDQD